MIKRPLQKIIKGAAHGCGLEVTRYYHTPIEQRFTIQPNGRSRGSVLLSLWIEPFLLKKGEPFSTNHTHNSESLLIARQFLDLGYSVDVIDYRNRTFIPDKRYKFFVGLRTNFERIARQLNSDCIKVAHLDTAHWLFNNTASFRRGLELQGRRGVTLSGLRIVETNLAIEYADCATVLGNQFTIDTYRYAQKPIFRIPLSTYVSYQRPEGKNFEACKRNFIWLGSGGLVHKGLDLILDAFSDMPDYHLAVCGPIREEKDFESAYYKELYETPNIHTIGWVDVNSSEFIEIANRCVAIIYPSCSEGGGGSVITCMHAGLIPIASYESSVDIDDSYGVMLGDSSVDTIKKAVKKISDMPAEKLKSMSRNAWEFVRANHTKERFTEEYREFIEEISAGSNAKTLRTHSRRKRDASISMRQYL
ncbi:MAG: glycosyltransferase [Nitrospirae bacterium]|nr:glycosyltransferase [Nitrospirota bacterium]